jgi:aminoglycoside phosphotransferase (APT) family kinase protein
MAGEYQIIDEAARRKPGEADIAAIRARYPTEPEIDKILTRKMQRRGEGQGYQGVTLDRLVAGTEQLISARLGKPVRISNARWLSGGASKLQLVFELAWTGPEEGEPRTESLVLRMEPAASVTESSRAREFEVIKAVAGIIPAPQAYWVDADGDFLPYPAMVYAFSRGTAKPSYDAGKVSGLGQNYGPDLRARLAPQFVDLLARLHTLDLRQVQGMEHFAAAEPGSNASIIRQVNALRRIWEEDRIEEEPIMEIVYRWLIANAPVLDHVSIVHGDYRSGNFLFDEQAGEITAWLDWEGATLGDRHQDLTYAAMPSFAHYAEDGETLLASGMMSAPDLYAAYEQASGLKVDPARITYFNIYNRYLIAILTLAASARASRGRGTHQDVLVNYVVGVGYPALAELRDYYLGVIG